MVMPAPERIDLDYDPEHDEPDPVPYLQAELNAEIGRLTAGVEGQSEIERIYRDYSGPSVRRKAIRELSGIRLTECIRRYVGKGVVSLDVICLDHEIILEAAHADRQDELDDAPVAQGKIVLPLLRAERGQPELAPVGTHDGRPTLHLTQPIAKPAPKPNPPEPQSPAGKKKLKLDLNRR
jgi:hypothetical protein